MSLSKDQYPENCLDMELVIEDNSGFPIEVFSRDHNLFIPAILIAGQEKVAVLYYFSESLVKGNRDMEIFLNRYEARSHGGIFTLYASSSKYKPYSLLGKIIDVPSVINYASYVWNGRHYFHFAFRHEYLPQLSDIMLTSDAPEGLIINRLGINDRMKRVLEWIDQKLNLFEITIETVPPPEELQPDRNPIGHEWAREIKCSTFDGSVRAVYCTPYSREIGGAVRVADSIFELTTQNELLSYLSSKDGNVMIPAFRRFQSLENSRFTISMILPYAYTGEYIRKIARATVKFPSWRIFLKEVSPYSEKISKEQQFPEANF